MGSPISGIARWYEQRVLPRFVERACNAPGIRRLRPTATAGLVGTVIEVGFGAGPNVEFYPPDVTRVLAVEPSELSRDRAAARVAASSVDVEFVGLDGARVPVDDDVADAGLVTFALCTIPDVAAALGELRRILKPGAKLHVLEHGLAPDESVVRWQRRLNPIQKRLGGGCHLDRDPVAMLSDAGFIDIDASQRYLNSTPKFIGYTSLITAANPA